VGRRVGLEDDRVKTGTVDPLRYRAPEAVVDGGGAGTVVGGKDATTAKAAASPHGDELLYVKLRYKDPRGETSRLIERSVRGSEASPSEDFRFAAAVAEFGLLLRGSEHRGSATFEEVRTAAAGASGRDREGYRAEFIKLVGIAEELSARKVAAR